VQLILGGFVQIVHFLTVPETRTTIMMNRIAKRRRKENPGANIWGPDELVPFRDRFSAKEILTTWIRPFKMFLTEPIVLVLSLLSGFSDALIFMFIQSFALVYKQWHFGTVEIGLSFIPIGIGYVIAWLLFIPAIKRNIKERAAKPNDERAQYESRLWFLLYTAPCLPIGLIGFAWTIQGPPIHWIGSMIFVAIVGIANYAIYMATIDYMICAYGPYSASATGGNGWARDFLAGVLTIPAVPFFTNIGASSGKNLEYASTILFCISFVLVVAVYIIYWKGPVLRHRSPFAQRLADQRQTQLNEGRRGSIPYDPDERRGMLSRFTSTKSFKLTLPRLSSFCFGCPSGLREKVQPAAPLLWRVSRHSPANASGHSVGQSPAKHGQSGEEVIGVMGACRALRLPSFVESEHLSSNSSASIGAMWHFHLTAFGFGVGLWPRI